MFILTCYRYEYSDANLINSTEITPNTGVNSVVKKLVTLTTFH